MARQYLGCPASSAAVERLFSQVGIAFSDKRKSSEADTLEDIMFSPTRSYKTTELMLITTLAQSR
eukprot:3464947-Prymnesium_polylepis.1